MKPPFSLRERLRESTRDAILDAAAAAFNRDGTAAVRMEDIAAGAGIAVGTLYNYFSDRRSLVAALLQSRAESLIQALDAVTPEAPSAAPPRGGVAADLRRFVTTLVGHWGANRTLLTLLLEDVLQRGVDAEAVDRRQAIATRILARAERLMARGIESGDLRSADAGTYAAMLLGMVRGVVTTALIRGDAGFTDRADDIVEVFLQGAARQARHYDARKELTA